MMTVGGLFSGIGNIERGLEWTGGFEVRWHTEVDDYCRAVLVRDWPDAALYGDVTEIDWAQVEPVDLVAGGFPCQPFSNAGLRMGVADERWMWPEFARCLRALRPRWVLIENVPGLMTGEVRDEPDDRCLCGWPYRRRGLHLRGEDGTSVLGSRGRGDDSKILGVAGIDASGVRGRDQEHQESDAKVGRSGLLERVRPRGGGLPLTADAASLLEAGASAPSAAGGGDTAGEYAPIGPREVDGRRDRASGAAASQDSATEPEGADAEQRLGGGDCLACGRPVGDAPARPVFRSGFSDVLGDLAALGYDTEWDCIPAAALGAPHQRDRLWLVAYPRSSGRQAEQPGVRHRELHAARSGGAALMADAECGRHPASQPAPRIFGRQAADAIVRHRTRNLEGQWAAEPAVGRLAHGPAAVMGPQLQALGNAVVPQVAQVVGELILAAEAREAAA